MIKAWYGPVTEDLVEAIMPALVAADIQREIAEKVIDELKAIGYDISIEVEVHGDMATAFESLGGDTSNYVSRERPKRKLPPPTPDDDHSMCGGGCTG